MYFWRNSESASSTIVTNTVSKCLSVHPFGRKMCIAPSPKWSLIGLWCLEMSNRKEGRNLDWDHFRPVRLPHSPKPRHSTWAVFACLWNSDQTVVDTANICITWTGLGKSCLVDIYKRVVKLLESWCRELVVNYFSVTNSHSCHFVGRCKKIPLVKQPLFGSCFSMKLMRTLTTEAGNWLSKITVMQCSTSHLNT